MYAYMNSQCTCTVSSPKPKPCKHCVAKIEDTMIEAYGT